MCTEASPRKRFNVKFDLFPKASLQQRSVRLLLKWEMRLLQQQPRCSRSTVANKALPSLYSKTTMDSNVIRKVSYLRQFCKIHKIQTHFAFLAIFQSILWGLSYLGDFVDFVDFVFCTEFVSIFVSIMQNIVFFSSLDYCVNYFVSIFVYNWSISSILTFDYFIDFINAGNLVILVDFFFCRLWQYVNFVHFIAFIDFVNFVNFVGSVDFLDIVDFVDSVDSVDSVDFRRFRRFLRFRRFRRLSLIPSILLISSISSIFVDFRRFLRFIYYVLPYLIHVIRLLCMVLHSVRCPALLTNVNVLNGA